MCGYGSDLIIGIVTRTLHPTFIQIAICILRFDPLLIRIRCMGLESRIACLVYQISNSHRAIQVLDRPPSITVEILSICSTASFTAWREVVFLWIPWRTEFWLCIPCYVFAVASSCLLLLSISQRRFCSDAARSCRWTFHNQLCQSPSIFFLLLWTNLSLHPRRDYSLMPPSFHPRRALLYIALPLILANFVGMYLRIAIDSRPI